MKRSRSESIHIDVRYNRVTKERRDSFGARRSSTPSPTRIPAECAGGARRNVLTPGELRDGLARISCTVSHAPRQQHRGETGEVECVGEEPGVPEIRRGVPHSRRALRLGASVSEQGIVLRGAIRSRNEAGGRTGSMACRAPEHAPSEKASNGSPVTRSTACMRRWHSGRSTCSSSPAVPERRRVHGCERRGTGRRGVVQREIGNEAAECVNRCRTVTRSFMAPRNSGT